MKTILQSFTAVILFTSPIRHTPAYSIVEACEKILESVSILHSKQSFVVSRRNAAGIRNQLYATGVIGFSGLSTFDLYLSRHLIFQGLIQPKKPGGFSVWSPHPRRLIKDERISAYRLAEREATGDPIRKSTLNRLSSQRDWPSFSLSLSLAMRYAQGRASHIDESQIGESEYWTWVDTPDAGERSVNAPLVLGISHKAFNKFAVRPEQADVLDETESMTYRPHLDFINDKTTPFGFDMIGALIFLSDAEREQFFLNLELIRESTEIDLRRYRSQ